METVVPAECLCHIRRMEISKRHRLAETTSWVLAGLVAVVFFFYGPIPQLADYHNFADKREFLGIPCFADVLSNLGFIATGLYALKFWRRLGSGYKLFALSLLLTGFGSSYYHWAPDNRRLVWDRLPISLVCAGLMVGAYFEVHRRTARELLWTWFMAGFALFGVLWWVWTERAGQDDLRPYLYLQLLPLLMIPLWHYAQEATKEIKRAYIAAIAFYALAKLFEVLDHPVFETLQFLSGHTLKHLLATAGGFCIVWHFSKVHRQTTGALRSA